MSGTEVLYRIKPLPWVARDDRRWEAEAGVGIYDVSSDGPFGCSWWCVDYGPWHGADTLEAAKAAAEDHHRARMLSALEPVQETR